MADEKHGKQTLCSSEDNTKRKDVEEKKYLIYEILFRPYNADPFYSSQVLLYCCNVSI